VKFSPVEEIASKFARAVFLIFVGWCPKKVPKVLVFFGLEGTLGISPTFTFT